MTEYCADLKESEASLSKIRRFSRKASLLFKILFLATTTGLMLFIFASLASDGFLNNTQCSETNQVLQAAIPVIFISVWSSILWFLAGIFDDISKSHSPISKRQAKRLKIIAVLLLSGVLADLLTQIFLADCTTLFNVNSYLEIGYVEPRLASLHIDIKSIVGSVFCFCLSSVFNYAAELQDLSDDTV